MSHWDGCPEDDDRNGYCGVCGTRSSPRKRSYRDNLVGTTRPTNRANDGEPLDRESDGGLTDMPTDLTHTAGVACNCNVVVRVQADHFVPRQCRMEATHLIGNSPVCTRHYKRLGY